MRKKIILDIETTGLNFNKGDKIIEICCLEIKNRIITNNIFHEYINPVVEVSNEAYKIHGIDNKFLSRKPLFKNISSKFIKFIYNSNIIIHNAKFDVGFLNSELNRIGLKNISYYCFKITDTLKIAKKLFPNKSNSLNSLCSRFNIILNRKKHNALKDCKLLAKIYLLMTRKQNFLVFKKNKNKNYKKYINKVDNNLILFAGSKNLFKHRIFFNKFNF